MKKILVSLTLTFLALAYATPTFAQVLPGAYADLALMSKYVWRGQILTDDAVLQPAIGGNWLGFGLDIWGNADLTDVNGNKTEFNEVDYTLKYGLTVIIVELEAGVAHYTFPNTNFSATTELYLGAAAKVLLSPRLFIYRDIDEINGTYIGAGISHTAREFDQAKLELSADLGWGSAGYDRGYFAVDDAGFNNFAITAELPWQPIPLLTITPSAAYTTLLGESETSVNDDGGKSNAWVFGLTAGVAIGGK